jgi:hypothetical protein
MQYFQLHDVYVSCALLKSAKLVNQNRLLVMTIILLHGVFIVTIHYPWKLILKHMLSLYSAANSYLKCVNQVVTDCSLDPSNNSEIRQAIGAARSELSEAGCGKILCFHILSIFPNNNVKAL